ncbi:MAG: 16S rRNA (guanine(966)-N(2))-methyltransferase RsmD [Anaerolineaceae bacterium]|nr:MAG: 16S rRNA (guanine(966)-N(2))-methyltransferase RsmD [Anaerolineaceae bacterium]
MAKIRVIAGSAKGRKLRLVPGGVTRPIGDRVKESLFNIIGNDVLHSRWLDLFAGTGSVGIEALSRGAERALFIDINKKAIETVIFNLQHTQLIDRAKVLRIDAFDFLQGEQEGDFDYIYIAPPQYANLWIKALKVLDETSSWLHKGGWVIVQIHPKEYEPHEYLNLVEFDQRKYGNTLLSFYEMLDR